MGFQQGLSGLNSSAKLLDSIGNNVANSNTVGFKQSQVQFADMYAASLNGATNSSIGTGNRVAAAVQQFTQGNITNTTNPLDVAINGEGFFYLNSTPNAVNPTYVLSRNGQFQLDKNNTLINNLGHVVQGYQVNLATGKVDSSLSNLTIPLDDFPAKASTTITATLNLDSRAAFPTGLTAPSTTSSTLAAAFATPAGYVADGTQTVQVDITVDGLTQSASVAIPAATYTDGPTLATALQNAINLQFASGNDVNTGLPFTNPVPSVTVTSTATGEIVISPNAVGSAVTFAVADNAGLGLGAVVSGSGSFDPNLPSTYNNSTSLTTYDSQGNPAIANLYFQKKANNSWDVYLTVGPLGGTPTLVQGPVDPVTNLPTDKITTLNFTTAGFLTGTPSLQTIATQSFATTSGSAMTLNFDFMGGTVQNSGSFNINSLSQDGYAKGAYTNFDIAANGDVVGRYTNGQTRVLATLGIAKVANNNGLRPLGNNEWTVTSASGDPLVGAPGTGNRGILQASAIEESNVDLTAELVNMITAQRVYQANAQTIKTQDQILQTLVNMR